MYRYIAFICGSPTENSKSLRVLEANLNNATPQWAWVQKNPTMLIAHSGPRPRSAEAHLLSSDNGVVLGTLFRRADLAETSRSPVVFDDEETQRVLRSECRHLTTHYWGKYVAFVHDPTQHTHHVLRDPIAHMRCYHTNWNGIDIFFSHIEDCVRFVPMSFSINWKYVIASLVAGRHSMRECGLNTIEDVPGGERLSLRRGSSMSHTVLWNAADFCRNDVIEDQATAARALRSTVQGTVNALASCYSNITLGLSGGLDSSILAGCLAQAPSKPNVVCLNHFLTLGFQDEKIHLPTLSKENLAKIQRLRGAGNGDERQFARLVSERWNYSLIEHERRVQDIDMRRIADAPIALSPTSFIGFMDLDDSQTRMVQEHRADAFFSGEGGDTMLYSTFQSVGAIDYAYQHGLGSRFMQEITNACAVSRESAWRVLTKSVKFGLLRLEMPQVVDLLKRPHLMTERAASSINGRDIEHPWVTFAGNLPPGKRNHVAGLAHSALFYQYEFCRDRYAEAVDPLCAQPVVETCLRIPSYTLLAGGVSRGLARSAFADLLPPEIQRRTTKGGGGPFFQRLTRENMGFIRETLLNGILVREGILDRKKLEDYLVDGQQFATVISGQILHYTATEAWAKQWMPMLNRAAA